MQAVPPAVAAMLAAFMASFGWREKWSQFAGIAEALKSERVTFAPRASRDYAGEDDEAIGNFVRKIEYLAAAEVREWRTAIDRRPIGYQEARDNSKGEKQPPPTSGAGVATNGRSDAPTEPTNEPAAG